MIKVNKGDFIEIDYVGMIKEDRKIFDLTSEEIAKKNDIYNKNFKYGPIIICIGEKNIIKGLDKNLIDKEIGKEYEFEVSAEEGFGNKNPKALQLVAMKVFLQNNIRPFPGLQLNLDGMLGTIRSVSGGRVIVDFNHPLAGKKLLYKVKILKKIDDTKQKVDACLKFVGLQENMFKVNLKDNKAEIDLHTPMENEVLKKAFEEKIKQLVPEIKEVKIKSLPKKEDSKKQ
ncbi:MAG: peptidylprolyl isomerase [Candidatus Nanoarchaeia archaeon]